MHRQAGVVRRRELEGVVHLDRVEGADLGAEAAAHAGVVLDHELGDGRHRLARGRIFGLGHMNDLRRADALALKARGTQLVPALLVEEQDGHVAVGLGELRLLLGVLHREGAVDVAEVAVLAERLAPVLPDHDHAVEQAAARHAPPAPAALNRDYCASLDLARHLPHRARRLTTDGLRAVVGRRSSVVIDPLHPSQYRYCRG